MAQKEAIKNRIDPTFRTTLSQYDVEDSECSILSINATSEKWYSVDIEGCFGYAVRKKLESLGYELINVYSPEYLTIENGTRLQFKKR